MEKIAYICSIAISVASFSFQIAGAVLLLLWSLGRCDKKIKEMCLEKDGILIWEFDNTTKVSAKELQENAITVYRNIVAFIDIIIGYVCAIFAVDPPISNWCVLDKVIISTGAILLAEMALTKYIAKKKYPRDQKIKVENDEIKEGTIVAREIKADE